MTRASRSLAAVAAFVTWAAFAPPVFAAAEGDSASAGRAEPLPNDLSGIEIRDHAGGSIPLDLVFHDERGGEVRFGDFFRAGRPVLLQLGYYSCPMLCGLVVNSMIAGINGLAWTPGHEFEVISVSIDPTETPLLARQKRQNVLAALDRPGAGDGWRFLTGSQENIKVLADAVGFQFRYLPEHHQYAHAAGIFALTPEGRVSRTLYGIEFPPPTLKLAMVEASRGQVGSPFDRVLLTCYHYDSASGRYGPAAEKMMKLGGGVTVLLLGWALLGVWVREFRRRRAHRPAEGHA